jgi:hypothetical protein
MVFALAQRLQSQFLNRTVLRSLPDVGAVWSKPLSGAAQRTGSSFFLRTRYDGKSVGVYTWCLDDKTAADVEA